jgi:hypothetical protein
MTTSAAHSPTAIRANASAASEHAELEPGDTDQIALVDILVLKSASPISRAGPVVRVHIPRAVGTSRRTALKSGRPTTINRPSTSWLCNYAAKVIRYTQPKTRSAQSHLPPPFLDLIERQVQEVGDYVRPFHGTTTTEHGVSGDINGDNVFEEPATCFSAS